MRPICFTLLVACLLSPADAAPPGEQAPAAMKRSVTVESRYLAFTPESYRRGGGKKWPLIIFLHGSGERGDDLEKVKKNGPPKIVQTRKDFPFVVVSPQIPKGTFFEPVRVIALLDEVIEKYDVDADRVYLTGLSMGGAGTWDTACRYPDRFAAIAPLCGKGKPWRAEYLKGVPVWAFWGAKDGGMAEGMWMIEACRKQKVDVTLTTYPDLGHNVWDRAYDDPKLYEWFLSHTRKAQAAAPSAPGAAAPSPAK